MVARPQLFLIQIESLGQIEYFKEVMFQGKHGWFLDCVLRGVSSGFEASD
jgi:hypothetical protein